jgi:hypothetical protein
MKHETNVDNYDIDAIERKMQLMSKATANRLGGTNKKPANKSEATKKGK